MDLKTTEGIILKILDITREELASLIGSSISQSGTSTKPLSETSCMDSSTRPTAKRKKFRFLRTPPHKAIMKKVPPRHKRYPTALVSTDRVVYPKTPNHHTNGTAQNRAVIENHARVDAITFI